MATIKSTQFSPSQFEKLDPELKKKWLAALRSGKYQQGAYSLRRDIPGVGPSSGNRFCCLGVACDIIDPSAWKNPTQGYHHAWGDIPAQSMSLPFVDRWAARTLSDMNDGGSYDFFKIADWIEENL